MSRQKRAIASPLRLLCGLEILGDSWVSRDSRGRAEIPMEPIYSELAPELPPNRRPMP
jgi:hypothetical protein